jgi:L-ascorbate metabolism protein UlaG (beta-lactamase superfamily)
VAEAGGLPEDRLIVPRALETLEIDGFHITPFDGLHWELISAGGKNASLPEARGVPATGYLVEYQGKRWLFPGDTRTYDTSQLPAFGPVDILFAHVWLGRGMANQPCPPLCDDFCRFCLALQPRRIVLTHLDEWGREALDLWDLDHARLIISTLKAQSPDLVVQAARFGDEIRLE